MAKNISFLTSLYMFLDNFGFGGGLNGTPNIQGVTKFDSIFSIIFYISVFMYFIVLKKIRLPQMSFECYYYLFFYISNTANWSCFVYFNFVTDFKVCR